MVAKGRVHFLAKDPQWTWIGWSLPDPEPQTEASGRLPTLRVHDLSADRSAGPVFFDVEVTEPSDHYYLRLDGAGRTYRVEVGFTADDGSFEAVAGSLPLTLPPAGPSSARADRSSSYPQASPVPRGKELGYLIVVLNAHLPFVRHPEVEHCSEENWLFENLVECYLPLLEMLSRLCDDGIAPGLTLSFSPTLLEMLRDPLLQERAVGYAEDRAELAEWVAQRPDASEPASGLARLFGQRFSWSARRMRELGGEGLIQQFGALANSGLIEVLASCASHAYLPLWASNPDAVRFQIRVGLEHYRQTFGRAAAGFWLPECGFAPGVDDVLVEGRVRYTFVDAHGLLNGTPAPTFGVHRPVHCSSGLAAFGRDWHSHDLVWRKEVGYPGDPAYLDRWRDHSLELLPEEVRRLPHGEARLPAGLRYWSQGGGDELYDPERARQRCEEHAAHFVEACGRRVEELHGPLGRPPVLVALFDAEHFGHWWHEGAQWLDMVVRKLATGQARVRLILPNDYLSMYPTHEISRPTASSWGYQGYNETWLMGRNHWIYPLLFAAMDEARELIHDHSGTSPPCSLSDQYLRELLLAQSSDWAFILHQETAVGYAKRRVRDHAENMRRIAAAIRSGQVDERWLRTIEERDNLFATLDLCASFRDVRGG